MTSYDLELDRLPATYAAAVSSPLPTGLVELVTADRPMLYVASGAIFSVARLAADLHMATTGRPALAVSPLEAASAALGHETGTVLVSARGRHPDALLTIAAALARGADPVGIITSQTREDLPAAMADPAVRVVTVPLAEDGFLATNGLLALAVVCCRAHGVAVPPRLSVAAPGRLRAVRPRVVALVGPGTTAVGADLEARLVETGLASVQVVDYRTVSHGRHVGITRNLETTTVVAVVGEPWTALARRTVDVLPAALDRIELESSAPWPVDVLELLLQSMSLTALTAAVTHFDPGEPGVESFGRLIQQVPVGELPSRPHEPGPGPAAPS